MKILSQLTNDNYFEDTHYMSVSKFKVLEKCEVAGKKPFPTEKSIPLLVGGYVDAYVEGTLEQFILDNPEISVETISPNDDTIRLLKLIAPEYITKNDTFNSKLYPEAKKQYKHLFNVTYRLKSDYIKADEICKYIDEDKRIQQFLSGEKQTIMTGEIAGVPFKIKMDSYAKGIAISDLKAMWKITDKSGAFYDFISQWSYDVQLACYQEIVYQNTGERLPTYIVAVTKETPINSLIVQVPQNVLDKALYRVESQVEHLYQVWQNEVEAVGCGVCKTCISSRKQTKLISMDELMYTGGM